MRISVYKNDPGYRPDAKHWQALLDGELLTSCVIADDENNFAVCYDDDGSIATVTLHGNVELVPPKELLHKVRKALAIYAARNAHNVHPERFKDKDNGWRMITIRKEDHEFILETLRELG